MHLWSTLTENYGDLRAPYTGAVTLLEMILYVALAFNVGRARKKFGVEAPSTEGSIEFRRIYRVQMNTLEQLALHLPLLWISAYAVGDLYAALLGLVWLGGRILYARDYYREAKARDRGFLIALAANAVLLLGAAIGTIASF